MNNARPLRNEEEFLPRFVILLSLPTISFLYSSMIKQYRTLLGFFFFFIFIFCRNYLYKVIYNINDSDHNYKVL